MKVEGLRWEGPTVPRRPANDIPRVAKSEPVVGWSGAGKENAANRRLQKSVKLTGTILSPIGKGESDVDQDLIRKWQSKRQKHRTLLQRGRNLHLLRSLRVRYRYYQNNHAYNIVRALIVAAITALTALLSNTSRPITTWRLPA